MQEPISSRLSEFRVGASITAFMIVLLSPVVLVRTEHGHLLQAGILLLLAMAGTLAVYQYGGGSAHRNFFVTILPSLAFVFFLNQLTGVVSSRFSALYFVAVVFAVAYSGLWYGVAAAAISVLLEVLSLYVGGVTIHGWEILYIHVVILLVLASITLYYSWRQAFLRERIEAINEISYGLHRGEAPIDVVQAVIDQTAKLTKADGIFVYENELHPPELIAATGDLAAKWSELRSSPKVIQIRTEAQDHVYKLGIVNARWAEKDLVDNLGRHVTLALERAHGRKATYEELRRRGEAVEQAHLGSLRALVEIQEQRDPYTSGHAKRVAAIASSLAQWLGAEREARTVGVAGMLHDLGKVGISDSILLKAGPLTSEEWGVMRRHPEIGVSVISRIAGYERYMPAILHHHERWDGDGYPGRLGRLDIPFTARLLAVADAFDAITTRRAYRSSRSVAEACNVLREGAGTQWDPDLINVFVGFIMQVPVDELLQKFELELMRLEHGAFEEFPAAPDAG